MKKHVIPPIVVTKKQVGTKELRNLAYLWSD